VFPHRFDNSETFWINSQFRFGFMALLAAAVEMIDPIR